MKNPSRHNPIDERSADDNFAARLLSRRDDVTIQEKERMLADILSHISCKSIKNKRLPTEWRWRVSAVAMILTATFMSIWFWPTKKTEEPTEFTSKGSVASPSFFEVQCLEGGRKGPCNSGARLVFTVSPQEKDAYFAALAVRQSDNTVIWMYPAFDTGKSVHVTQENHLLKDAIVLDNHYPAGKYNIIGLLSRAPLGRTDIKTRVEKYKAAPQKASSPSSESTLISELSIEVKDMACGEN